ncbi:hypothetical protein [Nonomuraea jabiensis]|uniref:hypothetical protein n=1 Tax=Nonomuraea jabiensis TaxID=882448 RepID=UPI0036C30B0E
MADPTTALEHAPPADFTKTKYASRLRGYLADQADAGALDSDPLSDRSRPPGRYAVSAAT